jgi:hypothetical protein
MTIVGRVSQEGDGPVYRYIARLDGSIAYHTLRKTRASTFDRHLILEEYMFGDEDYRMFGIECEGNEEKADRRLYERALDFVKSSTLIDDQTRHGQAQESS